MLTPTGLSDGDEIDKYPLITPISFNNMIPMAIHCRVELLWSSTICSGEYTNLISTVTGVGTSDSYGFGYWSSSSISTLELPEESLLIDNQAETYVDLGEVDILSTLDGLDQDTVLKVPDSTGKESVHNGARRNGDLISRMDGLSNDMKTNQNNADSDDDGISDGDEVLTYPNPIYRHRW